MIEGRPPFSAETPMATMLKHVRAKVPAMRYASKETARVVAMGLRKDRGKRIQTAGRFAELIGECIGYLRSGKEPSRESSQSIPTNLAQRPTLVPTQAPAPTGTSPGMGMGAAPSGLGETPGERTGKIIAVVLGVAALGLVAVMVFGGIGSSKDGGKGTEKGAGTPAAGAAADEAADEAEAGSGGPVYDSFPFNRVLVHTNVSGAKVFVDDVAQCDTPCEIKVPVDGRTHEIRLEKDGHTSVTHNWRPKSVGEPLPPLPDMKPL